MLSLFIVGAMAFAEPNWSADAPIPAGGRTNPYNFSSAVQADYVRAGKIHAQVYPVQVTGLLPPYRPLKNFIEEKPNDPFRFLLRSLFRGFTQVKSFNDLLKWVGLNPYPKESDTGVYSVPYPNGYRPDHPIGFGLIKKDGAVGFSISCAECHSSRLFGKTVLGLTNRFPRANETFLNAQKASRYLDPWMFQHYNKATDAETKLMIDVKQNIRSIGVVQPLVLGLDTSLAQVALSLKKREPTPWAERSEKFEKSPRRDWLDQYPADSKPAVWWNLKYKTRFLSDGSVTGGNPIFTNLLWNEVGRGADLQELDLWLSQNSKVIEELTSAVFSIEPPRYVDFFPAESLRIPLAQKGESLFNDSCAKCHGHYEKDWTRADAPTTLVKYPWPTKVKNVGTDPFRYMGMKSLEALNELEISKRHQTVVTVQTGYVPPPLVGIWARWPYFHNNSAPNLCAVLTVGKKRPKAYYAGPANDPSTDFDSVCMGYPVGKKTPESWKKREYYYDTARRGLGNFGHDERILVRDGKEIFSAEDKFAIIEYLKTL